MTDEQATATNETKAKSGVARGPGGDLVTFQGITDSWQGWAKRIGISASGIYKRRRTSKSLRAILRPRDKAIYKTRARLADASAPAVADATPKTPKSNGASNGAHTTPTRSHPAAALLRAAGYAVEIIDAPKLILVVG